MNVNEWLSVLIDKIASGEIVRPAYYRGLDCDSALDGRDSNAKFETEWKRLYDEIEKRWAEAAIDDEAETLVEAVRRKSFMATGRATRQHEIASYVSDDLDLIARGKLLGIDDLFLDWMWAAYERGEFPNPEIYEK